MRKLALLLPLMLACSSSPKSVRENVADGNLFDACTEARERKSGANEPDRRVILGDALAARGRVAVSARPLTSAEVKDLLGVDPFAGSQSAVWALRLEHDLPPDHVVARAELHVTRGGKEMIVPSTPQDRSVATTAVPIPPEPPAPAIPDLYVAVPSTDVTVPKPWEKEEAPPPKGKKAKPPKKPKKAEIEAWKKEVELAKKRHDEAEQAKVDASKKAQAAALAAHQHDVDEHRKVRTAREAAATRLGEVIRKAECPRDDEGFPVLRGRGACEVIRVVTWSAAGSNAATAELRTTHRVSQSIQTCELAQERQLAAEPDGAVFATPRAMSELKAVP